MFNDIYKDKIVLVTGHTGFKGSWLSIWLTMLGARVVGLSLKPYTARDNFCVSHLDKRIYKSILGDIRDINVINEVFDVYKPEIVFHLAAQPLVRKAYEYPKETYEINLLGSLNILESVRHHDSVKKVIMITTDKCYENLEQIWGYKETDRMGGYDPYSSSKGCAELMISSYRNSFFNPAKYEEHHKSIASVRAGNVIGGGDWSEDRLIPDCIRSIESKKSIELRNPNATRPWEHVLEPLSGYLRLGEMMYKDPIKYSTSFNFGPNISSNKSVYYLVNYLTTYYGNGTEVKISQNKEQPHENKLLNLDVTKAYFFLNWQARWTIEQAIEKTVDWYKENLKKPDMFDFCCEQIREHGESLVK